MLYAAISLSAFITSTLPQEMLRWLLSQSPYEQFAVCSSLADHPKLALVYWNKYMQTCQAPGAFGEMSNNPDSLAVFN